MMKHVKPAKKDVPEVIAGTAGMSVAERAEYAAYVAKTVEVMAPLNPAARRMAERIALCHWRITQFETLEVSDFAVAQAGVEKWSRSWARYWKRNLKAAEKAFRALQTARRRGGRTPRTASAVLKAA
jgi:hypothetical protein